MQKVDIYISNKQEWTVELELIRKIVNETELTEDYKWSIPVYTLNEKNVVGLAAWKNHVGLWFFNGVFLEDEHKILVNAQEGKTIGLRQLRFKSIDEIDVEIVTRYIQEAIQNQKDGKEIKTKRVKQRDIQIPVALLAQFETTKGLKSAFNSLPYGKQKDYAEYITNAKQEKTKLSRLKKITPMVLQGIGLNDKYKNC